MTDPTLVVKLPFKSKDRGRTPRQVTRDYVRAMVPAIGQSGLAQIVAYNDSCFRKPLAVVCEYIEGPTLAKLDENTKSNIHSRDYVGLLETFQAMQEARLGIEEDAAGNIKHNSNGFVAVDYEFDPVQTLAQKAVDFASAGMLLNGAVYKGPVPEYGLLYRDVCAEMLGLDIAVAIEEQWRSEDFIGL